LNRIPCSGARPVDAVAVPLAGSEARDVDVVLKRGAVLDVDPPLAPVVVDQAQLDPPGVL
jgi:hypothetical protein